MYTPPVIITYKKKRSSSGRLQSGQIYLSIAKGLTKGEEQRHIDILTKRLLKKWNQYKLQREQLSSPSDVTNDERLQDLARNINAQYYGFNFREIKFHTQNSLWGSCNWQKGIIHISHRLKGAPIELIAYVVAHELAHLQVPNHSAEFWNLVSKACPDYKRIRQMLKFYDADQI